MAHSFSDSLKLNLGFWSNPKAKTGLLERGGNEMTSPQEENYLERFHLFRLFCYQIEDGITE